MDKKFVMGIAAMAALTLVSCSSDDLDSFSDNSSKNEAISFDGYLGRSAVAVNGTRGSVATVETLKNKGFGVFGYQNSSATHSATESFVANLFNNQKVTYDNTNSKWTYSPLKFWPSDGHIDFLAYAPYDVKNTTLTDGSKINNFTVSETIADQTDLLWTNATSQITADTKKKKVNFQFHHALSRLGYTVNLTGDYTSSNVTFTLNKITLAGSADETKNAFYKKGTIDLSKANDAGDLWDTSSSSANEGKQNFPWFSAGAQPVNITYVDPADHTKKPVSNGTDYLFVIPQNFDTGSDELYVIVQYTIDYTDGTTPSVTNTVYKQIKKDFKQGKAYMLNLTLGLPIEFDVNVTGGAGVDGWGTDDGYNIGSNDTPWERK